MKTVKLKIRIELALKYVFVYKGHEWLSHAKDKVLASNGSAPYLRACALHVHALSLLTKTLSFIKLSTHALSICIMYSRKVVVN